MRNMPGNCIRNGQNREILASKAPVYDESGHIQGLVGYFLDRTALLEQDSRGREAKRRDMLTGLLNARGLMEEESAFRDEFYLRGADYVRVHISIDGFPHIVKQFGFEFGDQALIALGKALKQEFGQSSAIARFDGQRFIILQQIDNPEEPKRIRERIRDISSRLQTINGTPVTLYLSVGYAIFSECRDSEEMRQRAENSLLIDHDDSVSAEIRISHSSEVFHLYDNLPIPFAVYRVVPSEDGVVRDAIITYVNHSFEENSGRTQPELLGHSTQQLFSELDEHWYELAARAALGGESVTDRFYFPPTHSYYYLTASQVIHPGYCCFTYLKLDMDELIPEN